MTFQQKSTIQTWIIWFLVLAIPMALVLASVIAIKLVEISKQGQEISQKNQDYIRCLAGVMVRSQTELITNVDLDVCKVATKTNPDPTPASFQNTRPVNPQTNTQIPSQNQRTNPRVSQPPPTQPGLVQSTIDGVQNIIQMVLP